MHTKIPATLGFQVLVMVLIKRQVGFSLIYCYFKNFHKQYFHCIHDTKLGVKGVVIQDVEFSKLLLVQLHETAKPASLLLF